MPTAISTPFNEDEHTFRKNVEESNNAFVQQNGVKMNKRFLVVIGSHAPLYHFKLKHFTYDRTPALSNSNNEINCIRAHFRINNQKYNNGTHFA